jgi:hypothetical protein
VDATYLVVNRTINSGTVRYVERFADRLADTPVLMDAAFVTTARAGSITFDNVLFDPGDNETYFDCTAASAIFTASDVGRVLMVRHSGVFEAWVIRAYTSTTVVTVVRAGVTTIADPTTFVSADWFVAPDANHLIGESLSATRDGVVFASPNNPAYAALTPTTLTAGGVTARYIPLTQKYTEVVIGLPYTTDIQTLDIDAVGNTIKDKGIQVGSVLTWVEETGTFYAGPKVPSGDVLTGLEAFTPKDDEGYPSPAGTVFTGVAGVILNATWNNTGRVLIRQVDPSPLTVLAIMPQGHIAGRG